MMAFQDKHCWAALCSRLLVATLTACAFASVAVAQGWGLDSGGAVRIPSLDELSRPLAPRAYVLVKPEHAGSPLAPFLDDPTLRKGDIVATREGLMQFNGAEAYAHSPEDFAPVSETRARTRRQPLPEVRTSP